MDSKASKKSRKMFTSIPVQSTKREATSSQKPSLTLPPTLSQSFQHLKYTKHWILSDEYCVHRTPKIIIPEMTLKEALAKFISTTPEEPSTKSVFSRLSGKKRKAAQEKANTPVPPEPKVFRCPGCEEPLYTEETLEVHKKQCLRLLAANGEDIRVGDNLERKRSFMELFGMEPTSKKPVATSASSAKHLPKLEWGKTSCTRRPRTAHQQAVYFFRKNYPVAITSNHGQLLMKQSGGGFISDPGKHAMNIDKLLNPKSQLKSRPIRIQPPKAVGKSNKVDNPSNCDHQYHFGKAGRIRRNTELVLGVKTKYFPYLNLCKDFNIRIKALTNEEITEALTYRRLLPKRYRGIVKECKVNLTHLEDTEEGRNMLTAMQQNKGGGEGSCSQQE